MLPVRKLGNKGFTLIEMLVVIAIISILIGIGVNTFTIAQKKARDVKKKADIATIKKALIAYGIDHNGSYLCSGASCTTNLAMLQPTYLPSTFVTTPYTFYGSATTFVLSATLENAADPDIVANCGKDATGATITNATSYCQNGDQ